MDFQKYKIYGILLELVFIAIDRNFHWGEGENAYVRLYKINYKVVLVYRLRLFNCVN